MELKEQQEIANAIFQQYGGREFVLVTGAKNFQYLKDGGLIYEIGRNEKGVKYVETKLNGDDLYDVRFFDSKGKVLAEEKDVFADQLLDVFQQKTHLYASLLLGPSHLFLDIWTQGGVFYKKKGMWKRFKIAGFSYNNFLINFMAKIAGLLLLFLSYGGMHAQNYNSIYFYVRNVIR